MVRTLWSRRVSVVCVPFRVAQQARNLAIEGRLDNVGFLIHDRDAKYTRV